MNKNFADQYFSLLKILNKQAITTLMYWKHIQMCIWKTNANVILEFKLIKVL